MSGELRYTPDSAPVAAIEGLCVRASVYTGLWLLAALLPCWAQHPAAPEAVNSFDTPEGRMQGAALFQTHCAYCHGARGEGGRGADLTSGVYRHGGTERELYATIRNGVPGTEMPTVRATDEEVWKMVSFVKTLGSAGLKETATGDAERGKILYSGKAACAGCHTISGQGGTVGPELSDVGRRRGLRFLMDSLITPDADVPVAYRAVQVVPKSGPNVRGVRLNEDDISIQLRDTDGNLRAFMKENLKEIRRDEPSLMPAYSTSLSQKELDDVVAYLSSLRGAK